VQAISNGLYGFDFIPLLSEQQGNQVTNVFVRFGTEDAPLDR
jgi:hypothetical protein